MDAKITIKQLKGFQTAGLFDLMRNIYLTSEFMSDDFDRKFPGVKQFDDYYINMLRQPGSFFLGAIRGNDVVAYLSVEVNPATKLSHTAQMNMGIIKNFRGKGIGRNLIKAAMEKAKSEGVIEIIYLMVRTDHHPAIKLYESTGFNELAILEKDTKIGNKYFDGFLMRKFV